MQRKKAAFQRRVSEEEAEKAAAVSPKPARRMSGSKEGVTFDLAKNTQKKPGKIVTQPSQDLAGLPASKRFGDIRNDSTRVLPTRPQTVAQGYEPELYAAHALTFLALVAGLLAWNMHKRPMKKRRSRRSSHLSRRTSRASSMRTASFAALSDVAEQEADAEKPKREKSSALL